MKILTYNAWHGLNGKGVIAHGQLETAARRSARLARQAQRLAGHGPNLAFIQEVNPLAKRAPELARALSMNVVTQNDLCGIKVMGHGIPRNLTSGLAIFARDEIRKLKGLQLSGSRWAVARPNFTFQWAECRYALLAELRTKALGKLLVVNAHLHHGIEPSHLLLEAMQGLVDEHVITAEQRDQVAAHMHHARERRHGEGTRLLDEIKRLEPSHDGVILAGDFNADPDSAVVDLVKSSGLVDVIPAGVYTWNKDANSHNFKLSEAFNLGVPDSGIVPLKQALKTHETRLTRIDHMFMSKALAGRVAEVGLFGHDVEPENMTSDHFGLSVQLH